EKKRLKNAMKVPVAALVYVPGLLISRNRVQTKSSSRKVKRKNQQHLLQATSKESLTRSLDLDFQSTNCFSGGTSALLFGSLDLKEGCVFPAKNFADAAYA